MTQPPDEAMSPREMVGILTETCPPDPRAATIRKAIEWALDPDALTADDLRAFRRRYRLSQPAAADVLGVPIGTWRQWEQARRRIPALLCVAIAYYEVIAALPREMPGEPTPSDAPPSALQPVPADCDALPAPPRR